jgi:hypothetical protein
MNNNQANVAYNYQKNPYLIKTNKEQSILGFTLTQRDNTQLNRNVNSLFPINFSTPNPAAGSPTAGTVIGPKPVTFEPVAGFQNIT